MHNYVTSSTVIMIFYNMANLVSGKMNQSLHCDWLPGQARWSHLARPGLLAVSRKKNFPERLMINPFLTKLIRSRRLGFVLFCKFYGPGLRLGP